MLISFVVPVYNAEYTLRKCVNSILSQTYSKIEVLLVNDGSTDDSLELCKEYINHPKVKIIDQKNRGVSSARNNGIENSIGDYICFIDADDWIEKDYLSLFVNEKESLNTLLVQDVYRETEESLVLNANYKGGIFKLNDFWPLLVENSLLRYGFPFAKFYSKEVIDLYKIRFSEKIQYGEDLIFFISYLNHIEKIKFIPKAKYHYFISLADTSLSKKYNPFESEIIGFNKFVQVCNTGFLNPNKTIVLNLIINAKKGYFLTRVIESLYRRDIKKTRNIRILRLKELSNSLENRNYYGACNHRGYKKYLAYLFSKKEIVIFDLIYYFLFGIRYRFDSVWLKYRKYIRKN